MPVNFTNQWLSPLRHNGLTRLQRGPELPPVPHDFEGFQNTPPVGDIGPPNMIHAFGSSIHDAQPATKRQLFLAMMANPESTQEENERIARDFDRSWFRETSYRPSET